MSEEKVFVDGMIIKSKSEGTPDWVKEKISLKLDEFGALVAAQKKADPSLEWINIDIKQSQSGKLYAERDMLASKRKNLSQRKNHCQAG